MQSIKQILKHFDPTRDRYISREFQSYGIYLAEELNDYKHRGLYIKLAKTTYRSILEKALSFVVDSNAKNKGALFMWKLKELGAWQQVSKGDTSQKRKKKIVEDIPF